MRRKVSSEMVSLVFGEFNRAIATKRNEPMKEVELDTSVTDYDGRIPHLSKRQLVEILNALAALGELIIWNPETNEVLSDEDIEAVCMNGPAIQICLSETMAERRAPGR